MKKYLLFIPIVLSTFSCGVQNKLDKSVGIAFNSAFFTQIAMTKILTESTTYIFHEDSIRLNTPYYLQSLTAKFVNRLDSFELVIDSVKVEWTNDTTVTFSKVTIVEDSLIYNKVSIPDYNTYFVYDSVSIRVKCEYYPNMEIINREGDFKCLMADYISEKQSIIIKENYKNCTERK